MRNICLNLGYSGKEYHGWQIQKNAIIRAYAKEFSKFSLDGPGNVRSLS